MVAQSQSQARAADTAPQQIALIEARASGADAQVLLARAALDQARLNLERTVVRAPADGIVSRRTVELGQVVQPGQPLMSVTSLHDVWVTANFKETQLRSMVAGQRAEIEVDAYGGRRYTGRIESIAAATGATFSLLPRGQLERELRQGRPARAGEDRARRRRRRHGGAAPRHVGQRHRLPALTLRR